MLSADFDFKENLQARHVNSKAFVGFRRAGDWYLIARRFLSIHNNRFVQISSLNYHFEKEGEYRKDEGGSAVWASHGAWKRETDGRFIEGFPYRKPLTLYPKIGNEIGTMIILSYSLWINQTKITITNYILFLIMKKFFLFFFEKSEKNDIFRFGTGMETD